MNSNLTENFRLSNSNGLIPDAIELNLDHYYVRGSALINTWCDCRSCVIMRPFDVPANGPQSEDEVVDIIISLLNDNKFGCKSIIGAYVEIWAIYANDNTETKIFVKDMFVTKPNEFMTEQEMEFVEKCFFEE